MYKTLLFGAITSSTISIVSVVITAIYIRDINKKIDKLYSVKSEELEPISNISYTEWLKNKITN